MGFCFPYGCRWTLVSSAQHHGGYSLRLHIDSSERGPVNNRLSSTSTWTIPDQVDLVRPLRRKGSPSYSILDDLNPPAFDRRNRAQWALLGASCHTGIVVSRQNRVSELLSIFYVILYL